MGKRMYLVKFEANIGKEWQPNWSERMVLVDGGAAEAITVATGRENDAIDDEDPIFVRATDANFIAEEDS